MRYQTAALLLSLMTASTFAGDAPALIPLPQKMECREGVFQLQAKTRILTDVPANDTGQYLVGRLGKATGYDLKVGRSTKAQPTQRAILLSNEDARPGLGADGYELSVPPACVVVQATNTAGRD